MTQLYQHKTNIDAKLPGLLKDLILMYTEALQYLYQKYNHNETGQNIQMLREDTDLLYIILSFLSFSYLCLYYLFSCPCHLFLSLSYCPLNLHLPEIRIKHFFKVINTGT